MSRRNARKHTLQRLYSLELNSGSAGNISDMEGAAAISGKDLDFSERLAEMVQAHREEIDGMIIKNLRNWSIRQISVVDKNILRMAIGEVFYPGENPAEKAVVMDEAVELAREFGGEDSYKFVNGVLSAVFRENHV